MIIALAGRRTDAFNAPIARFPLENCAVVHERIRAILKELQATDLVASASCGADILALDAAGESGIRRHIVLPFPPDKFRATSVIDRPGDWGKAFDQLILKEMDNLILLGADGSDEEAFEEIFIQTNQAILDKARQLASLLPSTRDNVRAVVVWEGLSRGTGDLTANFATLARAMAIPIIEVRTH